MPINRPKAFAARLRKLAVSVPRDTILPRYHEIAFQLLSGVVLKTPVDYGRARNGWHVSLESPTGTDIVAGASPGAVIERGKAVIDAAQLGQTIVLQNNNDHIGVLEHGLFVPPDPGPSKDRRPDRKGRILVRGGYSVQAPTGMLADTIQEVRVAYGLR